MENYRTPLIEIVAWVATLATTLLALTVGTHLGRTGWATMSVPAAMVAVNVTYPALWTVGRWRNSPRRVSATTATKARLGMIVPFALLVAAGRLSRWGLDTAGLEVGTGSIPIRGMLGALSLIYVGWAFALAFQLYRPTRWPELEGDIGRYHYRVALQEARQEMAGAVQDLLDAGEARARRGPGKDNPSRGQYTTATLNLRRATRTLADTVTDSVRFGLPAREVAREAGMSTFQVVRSFVAHDARA